MILIKRDKFLLIYFSRIVTHNSAKQAMKQLA